MGRTITKEAVGEELQSQPRKRFVVPPRLGGSLIERGAGVICRATLAAKIHVAYFHVAYS